MNVYLQEDARGVLKEGFALAEGLTRLFDARVDAEAKRVATAYDNKRTGFLMRFTLPFGDPDRLDQNNYADALEAFDQDARSDFSTIPDALVRGKVESLFAKGMNEFKLGVANQMSAQAFRDTRELDKATALEIANGFGSAAVRLAKLDGFLKTVSDGQHFSPADMKANFDPIRNNLAADSLVEEGLAAHSDDPEAASRTLASRNDLSLSVKGPALKRLGEISASMDAAATQAFKDRIDPQVKRGVYTLAEYDELVDTTKATSTWKYNQKVAGRSAFDEAANAMIVGEFNGYTGVKITPADYIALLGRVRTIREAYASNSLSTQKIISEQLGKLEFAETEGANDDKAIEAMDLFVAGVRTEHGVDGMTREQYEAAEKGLFDIASQGLVTKEGTGKYLERQRELEGMYRESRSWTETDRRDRAKVKIIELKQAVAEKHKTPGAAFSEIYAMREWNPDAVDKALDEIYAGTWGTLGQDADIIKTMSDLLGDKSLRQMMYAAMPSSAQKLPLAQALKNYDPQSRDTKNALYLTVAMNTLSDSLRAMQSSGTVKTYEELRQQAVKIALGINNASKYADTGDIKIGVGQTELSAKVKAVYPFIRDGDMGAFRDLIPKSERGVELTMPHLDKMQLLVGDVLRSMATPLIESGRLSGVNGIGDLVVRMYDGEPYLAAGNYFIGLNASDKKDVLTLSLYEWDEKQRKYIDKSGTIGYDSRNVATPGLSEVQRRINAMDEANPPVELSGGD